MRRKTQPKKRTALQQEYQKQIKRITRAARKLKKEGYDLDLEAILGDTPKRVTKSRIQKLKNIKPKTLRQQAVYIPSIQIQPFTIRTLNLPAGPEFDEARKQIATEDAAEAKRKQAVEQQTPDTKQPTPDNPTPAPAPSNKSYDDKLDAIAVIDGLKARIFQLPERFHSVLLKFIDDMIYHTSEEDVAQAINTMPEDVRDFLSKYGSEFDFEGFSTTFISYLPVPKGIKDDLEDRASELWNSDFATVPDELR